ncbi:MAG: hypothetical protein KAQ65_01200 [Candidatus Thorarchaeota archaeon]|nr:hypothetical protein [Candidatus Thorarchaeota archaeon]
MKNRRLLVQKVIVSIILGMLLCSALMFTASASTIHETEEKAPREPTIFRVVIMYDPNSPEICDIIRDIQKPLYSHGVNVRAVEANSPVHLEHLASATMTDEIIYIFQSNLQGIMVGDEYLDWRMVASIVETNPYKQHVFGIGNAEMMLEYLEDTDNLYLEESDVVDLRITVLHALLTTAEILLDSPDDTITERGVNLRTWIVQNFTDDINEIISKGMIPDTYTGERVPVPLKDPAFTESWIEEERQYDDSGEELQPVMRAGHVKAQEENYIGLREMSPSSGVGGSIGWILDALLNVITGNGFEDLELHVDAASTIMGKIDDKINESIYKVIDFFNETGIYVNRANFSDGVPLLRGGDMLRLWTYTDQVILDAWYDLDDWISTYIERLVATPVQFELKGLTPVFLMRLGTPLNLGSSFASFGIVLRIKLVPEFQLDKTLFEEFLIDAVLGEGNFTNTLATQDVTTAFAQVRRFIDVVPIMDIDLGVCAFLPSKSSWASALLGGFSLDFFGSAHFQLAFPPIDNSETDRGFIEVREWGFYFELDASLTLSILDFLAPGASAAIGTILEWVDALLKANVILTLSVEFEISKKYQGQGLPSLSTFLLDIVIAITLDIQILICVFKGTFSVGLLFTQTSGMLEEAAPTMALADESITPGAKFFPAATSTSEVGAYLTLYCSLYLGIDLWFVEFGTHFGGPWTDTWEIYHDTSSSEYGTESADLTDDDRDGLPNDFEIRMNTLFGGTYLNPASADTDSDGISDSKELILNSYPHIADTDEDGLDDGDELFIWMTELLLPDTDYDGLTDYEECIIYLTNPHELDTDGDLLSDFHEVNETYDVSHTYGTYGSVEGVEIGGVVYIDKTDPLNPDTDNDGLIDGIEWDNGVEFMNASMVNSSDYVYFQWTHPLDSDTDDDSVRWNWETDHYYPDFTAFYMDLNDGIEVFGFYATIPDIEGYPIVHFLHTNPCDPDTDRDSADPPPPYQYMTDAYELIRLPFPTDPTDGDTDDDLLMDGYELIGIGGSGTDALNPDTDNDGLPDYLDWMLPTNPRDPDTDDDMVTDGDEYLVYGTDPIRNDTDADGLTDGEELFYFYCNPNIRDSDADGLTDGEEILMYLTDPLVNDTDHDGLSDGYEVFVSHTDPRLFDTDDDRLGDGEELLIYNSNPLDWDTDHDSFDYPNATHAMTLPLGDGDEVLDYGTSPITIDTDHDGLTDSQEIYLAMGWPGHDPIPLNPLSNDTDGDFLLDGEEMIIENISIINYPYEGLIITLRWGSCPVLNDTDGDGLIDSLEVANSTRPDDWDTDDDSLSDGEEMLYLGTNPLSNDTDGDEIPDGIEVWNNTDPLDNTSLLLLLATFALADYVSADNPNSAFFGTSATDSDTDDDLLPDGLELMYGTDPLNPDDNNNGILDGYEFDLDGDGLSDGEEFYIIKTWMTPLPISDNGTWTGDPGGFDNADSDLDGIDDGTEVHTYGSDPTNSDTDGDGIPDGEEAGFAGGILVPVTEGFPSWSLLVIGGAVGIIAGIILPPTLRFFNRKIRGDSKPKKKTKKSTKSKSKKEAGKK